MNNEIKQGDKVRVSKDAPKEFDRFKGDEMNYEVVRINPSKTIIQHKMAGLYGFTLAIPCKYLVKVEAEAKETKPTEPKFHIGQRVRHILTRRVDVIEGISQSAPYIYHFKHMVDPINGQGIFESDLEPYTEPTEQMEVEKMQNATSSELRDLANHGVAVGDEVKRRIKERDEKPNVGSIKIPVEVDLTDSYWDAYAADLAKDVAVKVANKFNAPNEAAEYAVQVAKAVVEGLKRK